MVDAPEPVSPSLPRRRWPRIAVAVLAILAVLVVAGSFVLSRFLEPERLASWVEPRIESAVNRDVTVGGIEVGILPLSVSLRDVTISDPTGLAPRLAYLGSLEFRVKILPLLRREVQVGEIRLDGLVANLRVGADGASNYGDFSAATRAGDLPSPEAVAREAGRAESGEESTDAQPFGLRLDRARISDASFSFSSEADSLHVELSEVNGESSIAHEPGGAWFLDGGFGARLTLGSPAGEDGAEGRSGIDVELALDAEAPEDFSALRIESGSLSLDRIAIALSGEIQRLQDPVRELRLALTADGIPAEDLLALVPDPSPTLREIEASGRLGLEISIEGALGPDTIPTVAGRATLADANVRFRGVPLSDALEADIQIAGDRSLRPRVSGRLLGGPLAVDGVVSAGEAPAMDLRVEARPDLGLLQDLLPEGVGVSGRLPSDVRVTGSPLDPASLRIWGDVGLSDVIVTHPALGVPASVPEAELTLGGTSATFPATRIVLGEDAVSIEGEVMELLALLEEGTPELRARATGNRVSLVELVADPPPDTALTYGRVAFAKVGGRSVRGRPAEDAAREMGLTRPASLPLSGQVEVHLDTLVDRKGRMEDVEATLVFGPEFIQVTSSSFRRYGGSIRTAANLSLGSGDEEPFTLTLEARGVDAGEFLAETTPLGRAVTGTLDLDIDLVGGLDGLLLPNRPSLQGFGSFALTDGGLDPGPLGERIAEFLAIDALNAPAIRDWRTGFVLRDGQILLDEATLSGAPGEPRVGGGVGLNGALDLVTAFDLPREELQGAALERLGISASQAGTGLLAAVLRVGGTLTDPAVRADPAAAVRGVTDVVEEQAREELNRQVEERQSELRERATGFLRGLLNRRDTTVAPPDTLRIDTLPPDTLRVDTLPPDTLRVDTLPPDTIRPDTAKPDTVRPDTMRTGSR